MYIRQLELEKYVLSSSVYSLDGFVGVCGVNGNRIKGLRLKMKESQKHMEELDKHL